MQRKNFNASKNEIWNHLAQEMGGKYEKDEYLGNDVIRYTSGEWEITLDKFYINTGTNKTAFTRIRAPFINKDGLYFSIYMEDIASSIGKLLGMQDIVIGDKIFDDNYIIKGNNEDKIKKLFNDKDLLKLIEEFRELSFQIRNDDGWFSTKFPDGVDELYLLCEGEIRNEKLLKDLFEIFSITLERLAQIDSAYEQNPNVKI